MAVMYFLILHSIQYQNSLEEKILPKKTTKKYIVLENNNPKDSQLLNLRAIDHSINDNDLYIVPIFARTGDLELNQNFVEDIKDFFDKYEILQKSNVFVTFIDADEVRLYRKNIIEQIYTDKIGKLFVITPDYKLNFKNPNINHIVYNKWMFMKWKPVDYKNLKKVYINMTRRPRLHRLLLLQKLIQNNLMEVGYNTFHSYQSDEYNTEFPEIFDYKFDILDHPPTNRYITEDSPEKAHEESFISLVTEHYVNKDVCFITEKIFRPIIHQMPFIILSSPGTLDMLKSQGYDTFTEWIDESYDNDINLEKRLEIIVNNIYKFSQYSIEDLVSIRHEMKEICQKNYDNWLENKKIMEPVIIWNELKKLI